MTDRTYARQLAVRYARFCAHVKAKQASLPRPTGGLSRMVEDLVLNTSLPYDEIVRQVREAFPDASTSTKSVASVACVMRKKGKAVPYRLKLNA